MSDSTMKLSQQSDQSIKQSKCTCKAHEKSDWAHVNVIHSDMRDIISANHHIRAENSKHKSSIPLPYQWHIVVSELLGSFGDNELSPECLFGVEELLSRPNPSSTLSLTDLSTSGTSKEPMSMQLDEVVTTTLQNLHGFSIPNQSRSFLAPVIASSVYTNIVGHNIGATANFDKMESKQQQSQQHFQQNNIPPTTLSTEQSIKSLSSHHVRRNKYLHTPYVTLLHNHTILSQPQQTFQFFHPNSKPIYPSTSSQSQSHQSSPTQYDTQEQFATIWNNENMTHELCRYTKHHFDITSTFPSTSSSASSSPSSLSTPEQQLQPLLSISTFNENNSTAFSSLSSLTSSISTSDDIIHGFVGYFDSVLFDPKHIQQTVGIDMNSNQPSNTIGISILPETFSHGMFSWFPLFFPLQIPIQASTLPNNQISVEIWRKCDGQRVWYEYAVEGQNIIHNYNGLAYSIGLSSDADLQ